MIKTEKFRDFQLGQIQTISYKIVNSTGFKGNLFATMYACVC